MERIGFIGLGIMGRPMAGHLLRVGYPLTVFNRTAARMTPLLEAGARAGADPQQVAEQSDVVITCVSDTPDVAQVVLGPTGVLAGLRPGGLLIDMSTSSPALARRIAEAARAQGADALDAPVSGGEVGAQNATLSIMVGGPAEAFARAQPLFACLGKNIVHIGAAGAGQVAKAANQIAIVGALAGVSEALLFAAQGGADPAKVRAALLGGFAQSRVLEVHGQRMLDRNFVPGFKAKLMRKDLGIVLEMAREQRLPLPVTAVVTELFEALLAQTGGEELDYSALVTVLEKLANGTVK